MNSRRRHKGEIHHQELQGKGIRSNYRKPPHGSWQPTIPSWEKKFCYSVGLVPWGKLLETKKSMYLYENVVKWNDSAVEEAFHNAKSRFWAKINGLPCDISLPDPDIYIDEIDWNSNIDPELYLDLEREPKYPDEKNKGEEVVIFGSSLLLNQSFSCNGWGEAEEEMQKAGTAVLGSGYREHKQNGNYENHWETSAFQVNGAVIDDECANYWNDPYGWNNNYNDWDNREWKNVNDRTGGNRGTWDGTTRKKEGTGWYMSRYKTTRFRSDDYQMDHAWWRNGRGRKRMNFVY